MTDILNQFKTLENSLNVSTFSNKKTIIVSLVLPLVIFPLFKPLYMYKKEVEKDKIEKAGRMVTVYKEKYKLSYKKLVILYVIYTAAIFVLLKFILKL